MKIFKNKENLLILVLSLVLVASLTIGKVVADTISAADIPMKDNSTTTIKSRLDVLASKPRPTTCPSNAICQWKKSWSNVAVGDYVQMTPTVSSYTTDHSKTGYTYNQTIYPQELKLWRVIKTSPYIEMVSEYVSSTRVWFEGTAGYANLVGYLNTLASQYQNSKYTRSSRYMGYNNQTGTITDTSAFDGTWDVANNGAPWTSSTTTTGNQKPSNEPQGGGDTKYTTDVSLVEAAIGTLRARICNDTSCSNPSLWNSYWLASRHYYYNSPAFYFFPRYVSGDEVKTGDIYFRYYYNNNWRNNGASLALRPIITLKSGLSVSDAYGTKEHPFILE